MKISDFQNLTVITITEITLQQTLVKVQFSCKYNIVNYITSIEP